MSVLFTGATGFLGCRVLRELLARDTDETITVLGRGSPRELGERVESAVGSLQAPVIRPAAMRRLRCVEADLTRPGLGLADAERSRLAQGATAVWHFAASLSLQGDPAVLYRTNVLGTRAVLELAEQAPGAHVLHVSTAFVAGKRASGRVLENDLSEEHGFTTYYEETKYTAERLVRAWARRNGRGATVLRPSVLVTDRPIPPGQPDQPLGVAVRAVLAVLSGTDGGQGDYRALLDGAPGAGVRLRIPGDPRGALNVLQAEYAASAMERVGRAHIGKAVPGARTVHVTHPRNTSFTVAKLAFRSVHPALSLELTGARVANPSPYEAMAAEHGAELRALGAHRRTYDRANLLRAVGRLPDPKPVTSAYLARVLRTAMARHGAPLPDAADQRDGSAALAPGRAVSSL